MRFPPQFNFHSVSALALLIFFLTVPFNKSTAQSIQSVVNKGGPTLGYTLESGVNILTIKGQKFKDLNRNGKLDKYEDWRLPFDIRAKDLASKMSIDQIAGLMLYSLHQSIPAAPTGFMAGTYNGEIYQQGKLSPSALTDQQKQFLREDQVRHVLITSVLSPRVAAEWSNNVQSYVEGLGLGIPVNVSSDPRNTAIVTAEYNAGAGGAISLWPDGLAIGATFDPDVVKSFATIASREYRALGITTALSPQIDIGTEPRWYRIGSVFSESPALTTDMARSYVEGFQTSSGDKEINNGWGFESVNAMVKHWAAGGSEEGGRESHWAMGKFNVFPGDNFEAHLQPYVRGAFALHGGTRSASAVMPGYSISYNQDTHYQKNVGNGYSRYMITDLLRDKFRFDGVVCTDWGVTWNEGATPNTFAGKPWGEENLSISERHYKLLEAGVDQFGGNNDKKPVLEAYVMGVREQGEKYMRSRFERSAIRLLLNIFRTGLFENPYLNPAESEAIVGNPEFMKAGYQAQLKSIVMLKNEKNTLPVTNERTVYIPKRLSPATFDWWGVFHPAILDYPIDLKVVQHYFNITDDPSKADFAMVFIENPQSREEGYSSDDVRWGGNGYVPISLQYETYTAVDAREHSIAAGDPVIAPTVTNRSYKNKTSTSSNISDLLLVQDTYKAMNGKPLILVVKANKPMIFSEIEKYADAILLNFGVSNNAVLDISSGKYEPSGLLPLQMPIDMKTVELQDEDVPFDMIPYKDSKGHIYNFGYGLNWSGVIQDARTKEYVTGHK